MISAAPADAGQIAAAEKATKICSRHAPDWQATEAAFKAVGYMETSDKRLKVIQKN